MVYEILDGGKAKALADLCPLLDILGMDYERFDLYEGMLFKARDFLVIRWGGGDLLTSSCFPRSGGMLVDWLTPE